MTASTAIVAVAVGGGLNSPVQVGADLVRATGFEGVALCTAGLEECCALGCVTCIADQQTASAQATDAADAKNEGSKVKNRPRKPQITRHAACKKTS